METVERELFFDDEDYPFRTLDPLVDALDEALETAGVGEVTGGGIGGGYTRVKVRLAPSPEARRVLDRCLEQLGVPAPAHEAAPGGPTPPKAPRTVQ